jgi:hypothetical protein
MSSLSLQLADSRTKYRPGERIEGVAFWELAEVPRSLELRLYWRTQGKGTVDLEVVRSLKFEGVAPNDRRPFSIELPASPYSVSGKLVSIVWGVELVAEPGGQSDNVEITMSPTGLEVRLDRAEKT